MKYPHWYYFVALSEDLEATSRYVEFDPENFTTYSTEFGRIILAACSEIDVAAKLLCGRINAGAKAENIVDYMTVITGAYRSFPTIEVAMRRYDIATVPWESWSSSGSPTWWKKYNSIKHERDKHYREASLKNAIDSVAGLAVVVAHLYHDELSSHRFNPVPNFIFVAPRYSQGSVMHAQPSYHLPDFPQRQLTPPPRTK
jgi:hypothetical protein